MFLVEIQNIYTLTNDIAIENNKIIKIKIEFELT